MAKQKRKPLYQVPADLDIEDTFVFRCPSWTRPGVEHFAMVSFKTQNVSCSCEKWTFQSGQIKHRLIEGEPFRCKHLKAAVTLAKRIKRKKDRRIKTADYPWGLLPIFDRIDIM